MKAVFSADGGGQAVTITVTYAAMTLEGYLVDDRSSKECVDAALRFAAQQFPNVPLTIDTKMCLVASRGERHWIDSVHRWLPMCHLRYRDGQLALLVQQNEHYKHQHSNYDVPV